MKCKKRVFVFFGLYPKAPNVDLRSSVLSSWLLNFLTSTKIFISFFHHDAFAIVHIRQCNSAAVELVNGSFKGLEELENYCLCNSTKNKLNSTTCTLWKIFRKSHNLVNSFSFANLWCSHQDFFFQKVPILSMWKNSSAQ